MKVWLYYRLSRDEDDELNSLTNQRKIIYEYAVTNGHEVVGESFDDNVSGMHFNREGIDKIYEAVEAGKVEAIIVKDLSRLGRHRTQTALFIDYLREHDVRVLSATENIDTFNENDDLIIGFKGLVNDFYARDGSRRVRTGYRQKQKEGIVITPPFGYFKDKNTKRVVIVEEAAETIRLIFTAYNSGCGLKAIAMMLNERKCKTPAQMQLEMLNKRLPYTQDHISKKYLWDATMIARILRDESYVGTLICHKSERRTGCRRAAVGLCAAERCRTDIARAGDGHGGSRGRGQNDDAVIRRGALDVVAVLVGHIAAIGVLGIGPMERAAVADGDAGHFCAVAHNQRETERIVAVRGCVQDVYAVEVHAFNVKVDRYAKTVADGVISFERVGSCKCACAQCEDHHNCQENCCELFHSSSSYIVFSRFLFARAVWMSCAERTFFFRFSRAPKKRFYLTAPD